MNLTKEMKSLHNESYETLLNEKEKIQRERHPHVHSLEKLILLKYSYYPKQSADSTQYPSKYKRDFFTKMEEAIVKFVLDHKRSTTTKIILRKLTKATVSCILILNYTAKV